MTAAIASFRKTPAAALLLKPRESGQVDRVTRRLEGEGGRWEEVN